MQNIPMTFQQKLTYHLLMSNPNDSRIPHMPESKDTMDIGMKLKELFKDGIYKKMYLDNDGSVHVE